MTGRELIERLLALPEAFDLDVMLLPCDSEDGALCRTVDIDRIATDGPTYLILTDEE